MREPEERWPYHQVIEKAISYGATVEEKGIKSFSVLQEFLV